MCVPMSVPRCVSVCSYRMPESLPSPMRVPMRVPLRVPMRVSMCTYCLHWIEYLRLFLLMCSYACCYVYVLLAAALLPAYTDTHM